MSEPYVLLSTPPPQCPIGNMYFHCQSSCIDQIIDSPTTSMAVARKIKEKNREL
uniref:Uncharacterized protein n=1 Tax=Physcomitrium patens TaxID=3218 RepID=A0A2K1JMQ1_PHYPA|nr:hypothetical protein PHYPA_017644 [Physcomitrium patens]